jgi:MSHA biogenesis protein MshK
MRHAHRLLHPVLAAIAAVIVGPAAAAEGVADPTRPPAAAATAPASAGSGAVPAAAAAVLRAAPPRVQSVQLPREGRGSALVDNRLVFVGDKLGAATISAIDAHGVQLRTAKGAVERLRLLDAQMTQQAVLPASLAPAPMAALAGGKQP